MIDRLLAAGAVVYGKTNVPVHADGLAELQRHLRHHQQPLGRGARPGGSSGGEAAALAAGLSALGAGSDIAGSLRNPAHYCGVYGHKPSWGLIPTRGHAPPGVMTPTDISVVGPMARHAEDLDLALRVLAGPDLLQQRPGGSSCRRRAHRRLGDFRVAVWLARRSARSTRSVSRALRRRPSSASGAPGRRSTSTARPAIADAEHHRLFMLLLRAATAVPHARRGFRRAAGDRCGLGARRHQLPRRRWRAARRCDHRAWGIANEARTKLRYAVARILPALRRVADAGRGDRRLPAQPQPGPRRAARSRSTASRCRTATSCSGPGSPACPTCRRPRRRSA